MAHFLFFRCQKIPHNTSYTSHAKIDIVSSPSMTGENSIDRNLTFNLVDTHHGCIPSPAISQSPTVSALEAKPLQLASSYCSVRSVTGSNMHLDNTTLMSNASMPITSNQQLLVKNHHSAPSTLHLQHDTEKVLHSFN